MTIIDVFDRGWQANPHGTAYIQDERRYSFQKTGELSCGVANALICNGYGKGAKGAVWADNDVGAWVCVLGLWRAGMAHVPVDVRDIPEEIQVTLNTFDCAIVFFQQAYAGIVNELRSRLPKVRRWVCIDANLPWAPSLAEWSDGQPVTPPRVDIDEDDVALLSTAGGAPGMARGALIAHRALQTEVVQFMRVHPYEGTMPVHLAVVPLTQAAGLLSLACTAQGGTVVVATSPDAGSVLDAIAKHKVTELFMRAAMLCRLLEMTHIGTRDVSSLKYFPVRGRADAGRETEARARDVRSGHGRHLRPARRVGHDRVSAAGRSRRRWQPRFRGTVVFRRPSGSAGPYRDNERA